MNVLGIDVGGSGIKGAVVDIRTGALVTDRIRLKTPRPSTPAAVGAVVARLVERLEWSGPVGCGMPGPIKEGIVTASANLHRAWIGTNAVEVYSASTRVPVAVVNDADAAGLAEMKYGAGRRQRGVVIVMTLGTGIGSALFVDGTLVPNTELGQLEVRGRAAEQRASARVRKEKNLTWQKWARRLNEYFAAVEMLLWPDLIIIGGGVSRKAERFLPHLTTRARLVPALLRNEAGIVGAAVAAWKRRTR
jgi:polyphosphate glucokinase